MTDWFWVIFAVAASMLFAVGIITLTVRIAMYCLIPAT